MIKSIIPVIGLSLFLVVACGDSKKDAAATFACPYNQISEFKDMKLSVTDMAKVAGATVSNSLTNTAAYTITLANTDTLLGTFVSSGRTVTSQSVKAGTAEAKTGFVKSSCTLGLYIEETISGNDYKGTALFTFTEKGKGVVNTSYLEPLASISTGKGKFTLGAK